MDHTHIRDMDDLSEAAFAHLVLVLQGSWVVFIWCFLTSIWFKMQGESIGFLLTVAMNSGEEVEAAAASGWSWCKKQASANGNTSDNVYSPSWIKMDMSICCHSSSRNVFLLKDLGKKIHNSIGICYSHLEPNPVVGLWVICNLSIVAWSNLFHLKYMRMFLSGYNRGEVPASE